MKNGEEKLASSSYQHSHFFLASIKGGGGPLVPGPTHQPPLIVWHEWHMQAQIHMQFRQGSSWQKTSTSTSVSNATDHITSTRHEYKEIPHTPVRVQGTRNEWQDKCHRGRCQAGRRARNWMVHACDAVAPCEGISETYRVNPKGVWNPKFCVGWFEFYLCKNFATAPKMRENFFAIFPSGTQLCGAVFG